MLTLTLGGEECEYYCYIDECFKTSPERDVTFNHCLKAIAKWEMRYCEPFLEKKQLTNDQALYYFACMADKPITRADITERVMNALNTYITANVTATTFNEDPLQATRKSQKTTSELIYGYMVVGQIPIECDEWHIDRLMTLIKVVNYLQTPDDKKKKMSPSEIARQNADLNARRRAEMNSRG